MVAAEKSPVAARLARFGEFAVFSSIAVIDHEHSALDQGRSYSSSAPEVWLMSDRGVTASGACQDLRIVLMLSSSLKRPSSTSLMAAMAVTGLLMEAA